MSEPEREPTARDSARLENGITAVLLLARLILLSLFVGEILRGNVGGPNVFRFRDIALSHGTPWRDFPVEYAPLDWLLIRTLFASTPIADAFRMALLAFAADIATFLGVRRGWGSRPALLYLLVGFPLQGFIYQRTDLVGVAFAVWALALARESRERAAGITLAAAVLLKVWGFVLLPVLWVERRTRAIAWSVAIVVASGIVWVGAVGLEGPREVLTFRGATGWQVESPIGWFVWIFSGDRATLQQGAYRVGTKPAWVSVLLLVALVVGLVAGAARERRRPTGDPAGLPASSAVAWLLLLSPIVSTQYVTWLLPWGAIAEGDDGNGRAAFISVLGASIGTAFIDAYAYLGHPLGFRIAVLARNLALAGPVVIWLSSPRRRVEPRALAGAR